METVARADPVVAVRLNDHRATVTPPGLPGTLGFSRTFLLDGVRAAWPSTSPWRSTRGQHSASLLLTDPTTSTW